MFRWYVVSTYSGHEDKVSRNLEHRRTSMGAEHAIRRIVVPKEEVIETKDGQKVAKPRTKLPGYVLVEMDALPETVTLVRGLATFWPSLVSMTSSLGTTMRRMACSAPMDVRRCSRLRLTLSSWPE